MIGWIILFSCFTLEHATGTEHLLEFRILRIGSPLRFFLGVEVVEVAEKFIEPVDRWQVFVHIAKVILPKLPGRVALGLEELRHRDVAILKPYR